MNRDYKLEERFECAICLNCLNEPYITSCGHRFCQECILEWLRLNGSCPTDGTVLSQEKDLFPDNYTKREIAVQRIQCPYPGCEKELPLLDIDNHIQDTHRKQLTIEIDETTNQITMSNSDCTEETTSLWEPLPKLQTSNMTDDSTQNLLKSLYERVISIEQRLIEHDNELKTIREHIAKKSEDYQKNVKNTKVESNSTLTLINGNCIWKLYNMQKKLLGLRTRPSGSYHTDGFYPQHGGYQFCAHVHLTSDKKYVSLLIHLKKGVYDDYLKWPFKGQIAFTIIHPTKPELSIKKVINAEKDLKAFRKPIEESKIVGVGLSEVLLTEDLKKLDYYNDDGSISIMIKIISE